MEKKLAASMKDNNLKRKAQSSHRYSFIVQHRGGPLTKEQHHRLIKWARECSEHVLSLIDQEIDPRLLNALEVAKQWEKELVPTGAAMKASLEAHAVARQVQDPVYKAIARSVGQTVATAHMADHSLGGAFYALKAIKLANKNIKEEQDWQTEKLNELLPELKEIVRKMMITKELDRRL